MVIEQFRDRLVCSFRVLGVYICMYSEYSVCIDPAAGYDVSCTLFLWLDIMHYNHIYALMYQIIFINPEFKFNKF